MSFSRTALLTVILLAGVVAFVGTLREREYASVHGEVALAFALRVVGGLVALAGLIGLLGQWYAGAGVARLVGGGVVVLAGLAVAYQSWGAFLGLAVVLAAALVLPHRRASDVESGTAPDRRSGQA